MTGGVAAARPSGAARWRVAARLARRQVWRTKLSSLLVLTLVALPIAAITTYLVVAMSSMPTPQEKTAVELGRMQAWIAAVSVPGEGCWQVPDDPTTNGYPTDASGGYTFPDGAPLSDPTTLLPAGTDTVELTTGSVRTDTAGGIGVLRAWSGDAWNPRFAGRYDLVEGREPTAPNEAMVTPAALERLGIPLGGTLSVPDLRASFTVVGTLRAAELKTGDAALFLPGTDAVRAVVGAEPRWYLPDKPLSWTDVQKLNDEGVVAYSREVVLDPPADVRREVRQLTSGATLSMIVILLVAAGVFAGYVVVMLAGAAFAVAARRQQRSLAVTASVGADRRDLGRTIRLQGTVLGSLGGVVGIGIGVGAAAVLMAALADGRATQFWGFHAPWPALAAILVFAVLVGTASALVPARSVSRTDILSSLRGARRPQSPRRSRPVWGSILLFVGVAMTIASAVAMAALNAAHLSTGPWQNVVYGIMAGPIIAQLGILLSGAWLLWILGRALSRTTMAARLSSRDAAANAGRTVPAFAAIAATVFLGTFGMGAFAMQAADTARHWNYAAPVGDVAFTFWAQDTRHGALPAISEEDANAAASAAVGLALDTGATATAVLSTQPEPSYGANDVAEVPKDATWVVGILPQRYLVAPGGVVSWSGRQQGNNITVIAPDEVETALGVGLTDAQLQAYRDGAAIVTDGRYVTDGRIEVGSWTGVDQYEGRAPDNIWRPVDGAPGIATPSWTKPLDAISVDAALQPTIIAIAHATADGLGLVVQPNGVIAALDTAPTPEDMDRLNQQAAAFSAGAPLAINTHLELGPPGIEAWLIPLTIVLAVLVLGASSVALGLARFERRPDDATLAAIGGTRALRRRIGFWQGLIIAGFGTLAGAAAGILPSIGLAIASGGTLQLADIPWWTIAGIAIALPLAIAVANWLVPPRHPDLTRRTVIA
ncbi:FtsX-like permease family protein [Microbacterium sp. ASV49]|uniref:ABC transporter permease n=1 Tax=Microbacterium candidum TaxID=3041922 RepID=A0ABT7N0Y8_9MICO|nr:FtsX-like permease family protein [Microbacterium sp. ASV49]MDL9980362.1 ABC transporter permease [Microbacterium sp. ASV49]